MACLDEKIQERSESHRLSIQELKVIDDTNNQLSSLALFEQPTKRLTPIDQREQSSMKCEEESACI